VDLRKFSAVFGTRSVNNENMTLPTGLSPMVISKKVSGRWFSDSGVDIVGGRFIDASRYSSDLKMEWECCEF
jgi:hypothetical protein